MQAQQRSADPAFVAFASGILAADLQLSAYLYSQGVPYTMISAALAVSESICFRCALLLFQLLQRKL